MIAAEKKGTPAVLALIFGIAGIILVFIPFINFLGFILSIAAIVLGAVEISRINQGKSSANGKGFSLTGIILGAVAIVLGIVFGVVLTMVIGGLIGYFGNFDFSQLKT